MFILGSEVEEFEREIAEYCGSDYAIGVSNGTDALILILKAMGIGPRRRGNYLSKLIYCFGSRNCPFRG